MKKLYTLLFFILISFAANAQDNPPGIPFRNNFIYAELSAVGMYSKGAATVNYERTLIRKAFNVYARIGAGGWAGPWIIQGIDQRGPKINIGAGIFTGRGDHHFDLQSGGEAYWWKSTTEESAGNMVVKEEMSLHPYIMGGYRYQKPGKAFMFRAAAASYGYLSLSSGFGF